MEEELSISLIDKGKRLEWIDTARGIAMLCVILGHMNIGGLKHIIFSFHMPLFFLLGGFFLKPQKISALTAKKAKHLLIPYLFTGICLLLLSQITNLVKMMLYREDVYSAEYLFVEWLKAILLGSGGRTDFLWVSSDIFIGAVWFLLALFFSELIVCSVGQQKFAWVYLLGIAGLGVLSAKYFWLPLSIQSAAVATVYVRIGYHYSQGSKINCIIKNKKVIIGCFILWFMYLYLLFHFDKNLSLAGARFLFWPVDYVCSTAASIVVLWGTYQIMPFFMRLNRILAWFGANSLIVLCFHLIEMNCIPFWRIVDFGLSLAGIESWAISGLITYAFKIIWAGCAIVIVKRLKIMRWVFGVGPI